MGEDDQSSLCSLFSVRTHAKPILNMLRQRVAEGSPSFSLSLLKDELKIVDFVVVADANPFTLITNSAEFLRCQVYGFRVDLDRICPVVGHSVRVTVSQ